jgi:hypothetical protein
LLLAVVVVGAAATTWQLWEQDAFWQVRAGRELWTTWGWPSVDTWSYTAAGGPWHNFQWLSTLLMAAADGLAGIAGLVLLRDVAVAAVLLATLISLRRRGADASFAIALIGLVWLACARRFQVRSDLFVTVIFAAVLALDASSLTWRARRIALVALVVLSANLHPGTTPFVQLAALMALDRDRRRQQRSWRQEILPVAAIVAGLLVTPYHLHVVPYLWRHLFYQSYRAVPNPDHRSLALAHFLPSAGGLGPMAWLVLVVAAGIVLVRGLRSRQAVARDGASLSLLLLLAGMSVNRDRVMPYAAIFAASVIAELVPGRPLARRSFVLRAVLAAGIWLVAIPLWLSRPEVRFGLGINPSMHPVGAARFIAAHRPQRQILHFQGDGNYLLWALPDYPVFLDTRESMYDHMGPIYRDMVNNPDLMKQVMTRYQINTVLVPETFLLAPWKTGVTRRAAFFPKRDFALVYFDDTHALLLRRIPEHAALIAQHEYELLLPYRSPTAYLSLRDRTPERDRAFRREVERCLREVPGLLHCQMAAAALPRL